MSHRMPYRRFDAVVAADGTGDYLLPSAAFAAGHTSVFVRDGAYTETANVVVPSGGRLWGESPSGVVITFSGAVGITVDGSGGTKETAGTVAITSGTTTVTGTGTTFTNLSAGDYICLGDVFYRIETTPVSDTSLTLTETYEGVSLSGESYVAQAMSVGTLIENFTVKDSTSLGVFVRAGLHFRVENVLVMGCLDNFDFTDCGHGSVVSVMSMHATGDGLNATDCKMLSVSSSAFSNNALNGAEILGASHAIEFDNCHFMSNGADGFEVGGTSTGVQVTDSHMGHNAGKGVDTLTTTGTVLISSCIIEDNGTNGVDFDGADNVIEGCVIDSNGSDGILAGDDGVIIGCHIHSNGGDGIDLGSGDDNCTISGCHLESNAGNGINVTADGCTLTGNYFELNTGAGILINAAADSTRLDGNTFGTGDVLTDNGTNTVYSVDVADGATAGAVVADGDGTFSIIQHNLAGTTAPTANEDSGDGYSVGSLWVDTTNDKAYICLDATAAAAVWTETTQAAGVQNKLDATANPTTTDDAGSGYAVGSLWVNVTADYSFICVDATASAAVWQTIGDVTKHVQVTGSTSSTTSTTYVVVNSMTVTPPAGTYFFVFDSSVRGTAKDQDIVFAFHKAGTLEGLEYHAHDMSGHVHETEYPISMHRQISVNGSQAVDVRWKSVNGSTATVNDRHLIYRLTKPA